MFDITILAIGKIKEAHFKDACAEYKKRIAPYAKISIEEISYEPFRHEGEKSKTKQKEGERIKRYLEKRSEKSEIFILDENGKEFSSEKFAKILENIQKPIIFVVGGSLGIDETLLLSPYKKISLSPLTFPHELVRVILLEQLYRATTIINKKVYHY